MTIVTVVCLWRDSPRWNLSTVAERDPRPLFRRGSTGHRTFRCVAGYWALYHCAVRRTAARSTSVRWDTFNGLVM